MSGLTERVGIARRDGLAIEGTRGRDCGGDHYGKEVVIPEVISDERTDRR